MAPPAKTATQSSNIHIFQILQSTLKHLTQIFTGCFCLTDSETHLPASVPCNIPLQPASQPYPNLQPAPTGSPVITDIPTFNLLPPVAISSSAPTIPNGLSVSHPKPVFLRPITPTAPQSPTGTGNKVFVIRSLGLQNIPARASKWLEKNLHLLEIRLRLLSFKR